MKKNKPTKKTVNRNKKRGPECPQTLVDVIVELKEQSRLNRPLGFLYNKPNPFKDPERAKTFSNLILKIYNIGLACAHPILEFGEKGEREANINMLKKEFKDMPKILVSLLPKKERGDRILRYYKSNPELLLGIIHKLEQELRGNIDSSYKGKGNKKEGDIKEFWEKRFNEPYPQNIRMDDRTVKTIALSILAYRNSSSYDRFSKLYYEINKPS